MATRDNKITTNTETKSRQKRTRNRRHNKEESIVDENGHRGRKKRVPEIITKPVIESTNPFFIAVCAPETYKPKVASNRRVGNTGAGAGARNVDDIEKNNRTNVFLRQRTRNSVNNNNNNNNNINRFIHHPLLQHSRDSDVSATATDSQPAAIELSNEILFPSLGKPTTTTTTTTVKLNFKEMVMKKSTAAAVAVAAAAAAASESPVVTSKDSSKNMSSTTSCPPPPSSHKSISSGNIFLAAFQEKHNDDNDYDDYCDTVSEKPFVSSSALIDSCDHKYDRLYS